MSSANKPDIPSIYNLLEPVVNSHNVELYDLEYLHEYGRQVLRVYIDKEGGITLDDCEKINYAVQPILDENDPIPTAYILEVSSPGIERKLIKNAHFEANMGKQVEVKTKKPVTRKSATLVEQKNQKKFSGTLMSQSETTIVIADTYGEIDLAKENMIYCRLVYVQGEENV